MNAKKGFGLAIKRPPSADNLSNFINHGLSSPEAPKLPEPPAPAPPVAAEPEDKGGKEVQRKQRSIYLNDDLMVRAGIYRLKQGLTMSALIERALTRYLDEQGG